VSDLKLFRIQGDKVVQIEGESEELEKSLQRLIEQRLPEFFGIRFLASEYGTGKTHGGRIDTLGSTRTVRRSSSSTSARPTRT